MRRHLAELTVKDLALVSDLRLELGPGLTILTGETGAGKSLLVDALVAATGGRVSAGLVREGAERARVDAVFAADGEDDVVLTREIAAGRAPARLDDRPVPLASLADVGAQLVAVHGQHEQIRLARAATQRDLLDAYGAHDTLSERARAAHARVSALVAERASLGGDARERARRVDLLTHQVEEIRGARIREGEEEELRDALSVARSAQALRAAAGAAQEHLAGERSAHDRVALAVRELRAVAAADPRAGALAVRVDAALEELRDLATELRLYAESVDTDPRALAELEARHELLYDLERKYGATLPEVLAFADRADAELAALSGQEERLAAIDREEADARAERAAACAALTKARGAAAERLAKAVVAELADLGLPRCELRIALTPQEPDATGADRVQFLIAPNPGEPPAPLGEIASGGELSRIMLALEVVLAAHDDVPVLVFDEVDLGVGGRLGEVVGRKLWSLARHHQVLCVSHLAQVAAYADRHIRVRKEVRKGRTHVIAEALEGAGALEELGAMLGAGARPRELARAAADWKRG